MVVKFVILSNRQGKTRLTKWYTSEYNQKQKMKVIKEVGYLVNQREKKKCNFVQWREYTLVYKRYASLYFTMALTPGDNEILCMELIHQFVEILDSYFSNVCELDLIFNFDRAHYILDELLLGGCVCETSKREVIRVVKAQDEIEQKIRDEVKQSKSFRKRYVTELFSSSGST